MADKKLSVIVEGKISPTVQQAGRILDDFTKKSQAAAKAREAMFGGKGGASAASQNATAQALLKEKKLLDALGDSGKKLSVILKDQVTKSQTELGKELQNTTQKLDTLVKKYEQAQAKVRQLTSQGASPAVISAFQKHAAGYKSDMYESMVAAGNLRAAMGLGGGGPSFMDEARGTANQLLPMVMSRLGIPMGLVGALGPLGALYGGARVGYNMSMGAMEAPIMGAAAYGGAQAGFMGSMQDPASLYGYGRMAHGYGREGMGIRRYMSDAWAGLKGIGTFVFNGFDFDRAREATWKEAEARGIQQSVDRAGKLGEGEKFRLDYINNQMQAGIVRWRWRYGRDNWDRMRGVSNALGNKLDAFELAGMAPSLAPGVGAWSAPGYAGRLGAAVIGGMDQGQAAGIIGRTAVGGANVLGYMGGLDPVIRGTLGDYVAGTMGANSMMYAGAGGDLANAMSGAMLMRGGAGGVRMAQQVALGMGAYGGAYGGHDPFQKSYNIAAASAALEGSGASSYTRAFLAEQMRDPKVLASVMAGNLPAAFTSMNITKDQAQRAARDIDRGLISSRWYDTGENSPAATRMREIKAAGGPMAWAQQLKSLPAAQRKQAIEEAAPLLAYVQSGLLGGDVGTAEGMLYAGAGLAVPQTARATGGGKGTARQIAEDYLDVQQRTNVEVRNFGAAVKEVTPFLLDIAKEGQTGGRVKAIDWSKYLTAPPPQTTKPKGK